MICIKDWCLGDTKHVSTESGEIVRRQPEFEVQAGITSFVMMQQSLIGSHYYFNFAMFSFNAAILVSASLCFLRSSSTTCAGALATKRSF